MCGDREKTDRQTGGGMEGGVERDVSWRDRGKERVEGQRE